MRGPRPGRQSHRDSRLRRGMQAACLCFGLLGAANAFAQDSSAAAWPAITQSARPWTRWWWPGSAVEPAHLHTQLEAFAAAGLGGVEITPIYGARGAEKRQVDFLSHRWIE